MDGVIMIALTVDKRICKNENYSTYMYIILIYINATRKTLYAKMFKRLNMHSSYSVKKYKQKYQIQKLFKKKEVRKT